MDFLKWIDEHKEEMIEDLGKLIAINSVEGEPTADAPFGEGPKEALEAFLKIGKRDGFRINNLQNYAGDIEFGEGDETVGILAHVDVVPAGGNWDTDPFEMINDGEYLQGRGTQDDKGPAIAAYYAMRALKETDEKLIRKIRLILGTNEETGWGGMNYYVKNKAMPDFGFTPDAEFPVIFGEKGIITGTLKLNYNFKDTMVKAVKGGNAPNMVPDFCTIVMDESKVTNEVKSIATLPDFKVEEKDGEIHITAKGISAHGSKPELGVNAISKLMEELAKLMPVEDSFRAFAEFYNEVMGFHMHGEGLGIDYEDELSGKLNFNVGMISNTDNEIDIVLNMRHPLKGVTKEEIMDKINKGTKEYKGEFTRTGGEDPLFIDPDGKLVSILMDAYQKQTGDTESKPMTIGGGTYAKAMKNCVAYGAMFLDDEDRMHQKNERIKIDRLMDAAKIYAIALKNLASEEKVLDK